MASVPTLFLAPTASAARVAAWQFLGENGAFAPLDPPLVFAGASSFSAWRELARENQSGAVVAPRLLRAEDFFTRFYGALSRQRALRGADRLWVLAGVLKRVLPGLETLERAARRGDFTGEMANWIALLRRAALLQFPAGPASGELNQILRVYDAQLQKLGAFDPENAPALFPAAAQENRAFAWPRALIVEDWLDPSPSLQIGLESLLKRAHCVAATFVCPGGHLENPVLEGALGFWRTQGAQIVKIGDFDSPSSRAAARVLGARIEAPRPDVFLTAAHTPHDEMNRLAAHIRREIESGAAPDDFALACADLGEYEAPARHAFAAHGVPLDWPRERPLRQFPLVRALLCAAQSCRARWNVHELHDLFGDGTLQLHLENRQFDARRLRAAALAARHPELDDLNRARAAFEAKIAQFTSHPKLDEAQRRAEIEASLMAGDLEMVAHFQTLCAAFGDQIGASAWQNRWFALIEALAGHWMEAQGENEAQIVAQKAIERLKAASEAVVERARNWSDGDEEPKRAPAEWLRWLEAEIDATPGLDIALRGGVRVAPASAPPLARRTLFFCGLSEGAWPNSASDGPLGVAGREMNRMLRAHESAPIARAAHTLARAIGEENCVSLSHASFVGGHETPPSPLWDDLRAAWPDSNLKWPQIAPAQDGGIRTRRASLGAWSRYLNAQNGAGNVSGDFALLETLRQMRLQRREREMGVYDGVLGARGRVLMENWAQTQRSVALSGSALEFYARCPLRYFFERVLSLQTEENEDDDLDPRAAGTLVHEITRAFLTSWKTPFSGLDFEAALEKLGEITRVECEKLPLRPILREAEWHRLMGADGRSGPLVKWLQHEIALGNGAWLEEMRPLLHTSVSIEGIQSGLEHRFQIEIGGHEVSGVIDRLDASPDGTQIAVIDYKTGDVSGLPNWKNGDSGLHFQLAVYALAARHLTRAFARPPRLAMAYLSLRRAQLARGIGQEGTLGKGCSGAKTLDDAGFEAWLDDVSARAARIADLRRAGVFNLTVQNAATAKCAHCGSKTLCGQHAPTQIARLEENLDSPFVYAPKLRVWETEN